MIMFSLALGSGASSCSANAASVSSETTNSTLVSTQIAPKYRVVDATNEKVTRATSGTIGHVLIVGSGANRKYFKEKEELTTDKRAVEHILRDYLPENHELFAALAEMLHQRLLAKKGIDKNLRNDELFVSLEAEISKKAVDSLQKEFNRFKSSLNFISNNIEYNAGQDYSTRNIAATRLAELFEVPDLIVKTEMVILHREGKPDKIGHIMDAADGIAATKRKHHVKKVLPSLLKEMNTLQVFDAIFAQNDRSRHNYNVKITTNGEALGVVGYDNDAFCNLRTSIRNGYGNLPPMIKANGCLNVLHLEKKFAQRVLSMTDEQLTSTLSDLLDKKYINASINRLHKIQKAINRSIENDNKFLLDDDEWTEEHIQEEKEKGCKRSYFNVFLR